MRGIWVGFDRGREMPGGVEWVSVRTGPFPKIQFFGGRVRNTQ